MIKEWLVVRTVEYKKKVEAETVEEAKKKAMAASIDSGIEWEEDETELYIEELK